MIDKHLQVMNTYKFYPVKKKAKILLTTKWNIYHIFQNFVVVVCSLEK